MIGAFLVGELDTTTEPPTLVHVGIYSSPARLLTMVRDRHSFDIFAFEGEPFHAKRREMMEYLRSGSSSWLDWCKPYMKERP